MPEIKERAEAIEEGRTKYFTGRPCKHGHVSESFVNGGCIACRSTSSNYIIGPKHAFSKYCTCEFCFWVRLDREIVYRDEAIKMGLRTYFLGEPCKRGHIEEKEVSTSECKSCIIEWRREYRKENRDYLNELSRLSYYNNKEYRFGKNAERRAVKKSAKPSWFGEYEQFLMEEAYDLTQTRAEQTGFTWHVDHVVPLQHELVCGLHTPDNIQVIPASENLAKNNSFDPDWFEWSRKREEQADANHQPA